MAMCSARLALLLALFGSAAAFAQPCAHSIACDSSVTALLEFSEGTCLDGDSQRYDLYSFAGKAGSTVTASVQSAFFVPSVQLISPDLLEVARDANSARSSRAALTFKLTSSGSWTVRVRNIDVGTGGRYTVTLQCVDPTQPPASRGISVAMTPSNLTLQRGESRTLHVTVAPFGDYSGDVRVSIDGAPAGVTVNPSSSLFHAPGGGTLDASLVVGADAPGGGPFVVVASAIGSGGVAATAGTTLRIDAICSPPFLVKQPASAGVMKGSPVRLSATPGGSPPFTFRWYLGASGSTAFPAERGSAADFVSDPLTYESSFWLRVSNECGSVDSVTASVKVLPIPPHRRVAPH